MIPPWRRPGRDKGRSPNGGRGNSPDQGSQNPSPPNRGPKDRGPKDRGPGSNRPMRRAGLGLLYLAIGRRQGFDDFGNDADAYLASLAPLVAFDLVSNVLLAAAGNVHAAALIFLSTLCVMLAPAVVSHPICRRWGVAGVWPRYANILNWGQMLVFLVLAFASTIARLLIQTGAPPAIVENALRLGTACYVLWFQWFVARGALQLPRWKTFLLLLAMGFINLLLLGALLLTSAQVKLR